MQPYGEIHIGQRILVAGYQEDTKKQPERSGHIYFSRLVEIRKPLLEYKPRGNMSLDRQDQLRSSIRLQNTSLKS